jgi:hypothetical protein
MGSDSIDLPRLAVGLGLAISATRSRHGTTLQLLLYAQLESIIAQRPGLVGRLSYLIQPRFRNSRSKQSPVGCPTIRISTFQPAVLNVFADKIIGLAYGYGR